MKPIDGVWSQYTIRRLFREYDAPAMKLSSPFQFLVVLIAGWMNREPEVHFTLPTNEGIYLPPGTYQVTTSFATVNGPGQNVQTVNLAAGAGAHSIASSG
jgi:hypothetical protein